MKIEDCINKKNEDFVSYDTKLISDSIKNRDHEFLRDLYFKNSIHSSIDKFIICMLIEEILGYNPYASP